MDIRNGWYGVRLSLERILDERFALDQATIIEFDSVITIDEMNALGYARNFPHLTCLMCSLEQKNLQAFVQQEAQLAKGVQSMHADFALLPAACYKIYLSLRDRELDRGQMLGCIAKCFRHEDKPLDTYRAVNFTMKEFVYLGSATGAQAHLEDSFRILSDIARRLELDVEVETASDPFFDASSSVAVMSKLMPTKREIVFDGHAVSSLNYHRNYFGDKFNIRYNGEPVHTSCVAFGVERWMAMLSVRFGDATAALSALHAITEEVAT